MGVFVLKDKYYQYQLEKPVNFEKLMDKFYDSNI